MVIPGQHFVPYQYLATDPESLRFQTDVIIVYSGYTLCNCNEIYVTSNGYVNLHDKDGVSLSIALLANDLYNQNFWFSTFRQKHYAPVPQFHEFMLTPRSHALAGKEHYSDLYQYMRIYCEFKWMVMEDYSKGRYVGRFETYRQKIADALKNQDHIDHWKRVTVHPDPPRPQRRTTSQTTSQGSHINLLDLAHQVSEICRRATNTSQTESDANTTETDTSASSETGKACTFTTIDTSTTKNTRTTKRSSTENTTKRNAKGAGQDFRDFGKITT